MYDAAVFDNRYRRFINWLWLHPGLWEFAIIVLTVAAVLAWHTYLLIAVALPLLAVIALFGAESDVHTLGGAFAKRNKLEKFFMGHGDNYQCIYTQYRSMIHSTFLKHELTVWSMPVAGTEFATVFTEDGGCLCWMQLGRAFPHLVVDSVVDNPGLGRQWSRKALPPEMINLEGDFNHHFRVYQEPGEQIMSLQILSPDRMAALLDQFAAANMEIQDSYLRVYVADVQKSSKSFETFLNLLSDLQQGLKVDGINRIL